MTESNIKLKDNNNLTKIAYHINSNIDIYIEKESTYKEEVTSCTYRDKPKRFYNVGEQVLYRIGGKFYRSTLRSCNIREDLFFMHGGDRIYSDEIFVF